MGRKPAKTLTPEELAKVDESLGEYAKMDDLSLSKLLNCSLARVNRLKSQGCRRNTDGTWNILAVYGFLCIEFRRVNQRRRKQKS